jgi:YtkA-like
MLSKKATPAITNSRLRRVLLPALVYVAAVVPVTALVVPGCRSGGVADESEDVKVDFALQPAPPKVGTVTATVQLMDKDGKPLQGAAIRLEGNMNHAGMTPVFAETKESEPGLYRADLELTMGGDWFVLIDARLADGRKLKRKVDVPGVKSR